MLNYAWPGRPVIFSSFFDRFRFIYLAGYGMFAILPNFGKREKSALRTRRATRQANTKPKRKWSKPYTPFPFSKFDA